MDKLEFIGMDHMGGPDIFQAPLMIICSQMVCEGRHCLACVSSRTLGVRQADNDLRVTAESAQPRCCHKVSDCLLVWQGGVLEILCDGMQQLHHLIEPGICLLVWKAWNLAVCAMFIRLPMCMCLCKHICMVGFGSMGCGHFNIWISWPFVGLC